MTANSCCADYTWVGTRSGYAARRNTVWVNHGTERCVDLEDRRCSPSFFGLTRCFTGELETLFGCNGWPALCNPTLGWGMQSCEVER